jgi:4-hydroxybenzoate polyprenyltransferase
MKWTFFTGAAVITAYLLLSHGAPWIAVLVGIAFAALFNWRSLHRPSKQGRPF